MQFELDGYMVTIHPGSVSPASNWQMSLRDDAGDRICDQMDIDGADGSGVFDIEGQWHVRDDGGGGGAFTIQYLTDQLGDRLPAMQSFDASGNSIAIADYEIATRDPEIGGIIIRQTLFETCDTVVDLDGGAGNDALDGDEEIDLSGVASIGGFKDLKNNHMSQAGADVVIDDLDGNTLTLAGVSLSDLDKDDFMF